MAATTDAQICNAALLRIGTTATIDSLNEPTNEAQVCNALFARNRDLLLAAHPWSFAMKHQQLALLAGVERTGWTYCYSLPSDCLVAREIWSGERRPSVKDRIVFSIEDNTSARILLTDAATPTLIYTYRVENGLLFSAAFSEALAWKMAVDLALALRKDGSIYAQAKSEAELALQRAMVQSVNEQVYDRDPPSATLLARGGVQWP